MKNSRTITKIKINEKAVQVHYTLHHFTEDERVLNTEIPLKSEVRPHPDFYGYFQKLKEHAIPIMELSLFENGVDDKTLEKHVVHTLNIIESSEGEEIIVSMNKYIKSGKSYNVNSPKIHLDNEDYANLPKLQKLVKAILGEAILYIKAEKHGEKQLEFKFEAA